MNRILNIIILTLFLIISYKVIVNQGNDYMISAEQVQEKIDKNEEFILLDVRTKEEYEQGRIPGTVLIPLNDLENQVTLKLENKEAEIVVYCRSGNRSKRAVEILKSMGYTNVHDLGGIIDWPYATER